MKFEHRLPEESGPPFTNKQTQAFNIAKTLNFMKSVRPTLTDCSMPSPDSTCPFTVPNDDSVTEVTHVVTSLVLGFIVWHPDWSSSRLTALKKQ